MISNFRFYEVLIFMLKSFIKWFFVALLTVLLGGVTALILFKEQIINQVIVEVNKNLTVPLEVGKVDLDLFHGLPNISVAFYEVRIPANSSKPLVDAGRIYAILDPISIARGQLSIERLEVVDAKIYIFIDKKNKSNISAIFNNEKDSSQNISGQKQAKINLNTVLFKNIDVDYVNEFTGSHHNFSIPKLVGRLAIDKTIYSAELSGDLRFNEISTRSWRSLHTRDISANLNIDFSDSLKLLTINKSNLGYEDADFVIDGEMSFAQGVDVNINIAGKNLTFKVVSGFLPEEYQAKIRNYKSTGTINFDTNIKGEFAENRLPRIKADLQFINVDLTDESTNANIKNLNILASLYMADISDLSSGSLTITSAKGILEGNQVEANLSLNNFSNPGYSAWGKGKIATDWLLANIRYPYAEGASGNIDVEIKAEGVKNEKKNINDLIINGSLDLNGIAFQWSDSVNIEQLQGRIQFTGKNLTLTNVKVKWLASDMLINGGIGDIRALIGGDAGKLLLRSDVKSKKLNIEDIVTLIRANPFNKDSTVANGPDIDLEVTCAFDSLIYKRFRGTKVAGELLFQDKILEVIDLNGQGMGGALKLNGQLSIMPNKDIFINAHAFTREVLLDSLFYVFNNFEQDFIIDKNLKGRLFADVQASMFFDSTWRFRRPLLLSEAKLHIVKGELNNFEPIMALSEYINDKDDNLSKLRFADIVNYVTIKNDTIFIPEMSINTNVRNIALGGYHTLTQHINYRLAVPIIERVDNKDEAFGAIQKSSKGSPNLLFRIKGTTSDYQVNYDVIRASGNVLKLLDITKIFKKQEEEVLDSTFLNDEVFDWEN